MNIARHDADLALLRGDDAWTVGANDADVFRFRVFDGAYHINGGDAFGDTNNQLNPPIHSLQNRRQSEGRRNINHRRGSASFGDGVFDRVKNRNGSNHLPAFFGSDAANQLSAVLQALE